MNEWYAQNKDRINKERKIKYRKDHPIGDFRECSKCGETKNINLFYKSGPGGRDRFCSDCRSKERRIRRLGALSETHRRCTGCGETKTIDNFLQEKRKNIDGVRLGSKCPQCRKEYSRKYWAQYPKKEMAYARNAQWNHTHKEHAHKTRLRRVHGLPLGSYEKMFQNQGGRCAICGTDKAGGRSTRFNVDHDHKTGKVRGLLCTACNKGLGLFGDSIRNLFNAINYLGENKTCLRLIEAS